MPTSKTSFFSTGRTYTQLDPTAVEQLRDEAQAAATAAQVAQAAAEEAVNQGSLILYASQGFYSSISAAGRRAASLVRAAQSVIDASVSRVTALVANAARSARASKRSEHNSQSESMRAGAWAQYASSMRRLISKDMQVIRATRDQTAGWALNSAVHERRAKKYAAAALQSAIDAAASAAAAAVSTDQIALTAAVFN